MPSRYVNIPSGAHVRSLIDPEDVVVRRRVLWTWAPQLRQERPQAGDPGRSPLLMMGDPTFEDLVLPIRRTSGEPIRRTSGEQVIDRRALGNMALGWHPSSRTSKPSIAGRVLVQFGQLLQRAHRATQDG